jgi:DNA phosphorothioation-dependent restriction protein DptG
MDNLNTIETPALIDLLAEYTSKYTLLLTNGSVEEYEKCKLTMEAIMKEIELRKQSYDENSTPTTQPPDFTL